MHYKDLTYCDYFNKKLNMNLDASVMAIGWIDSLSENYEEERRSKEGNILILNKDIPNKYKKIQPYTKGEVSQKILIRSKKLSKI